MVILYILLTGIPPFNGANDDEILNSVQEGKVDLGIPEFDGISSSAKDLIGRLLNKNHKQRPSAKEILSHRWFKEMNNNLSTKQIDKSVLNNLKKFETKSQLQRAIYFFIINNLTTKDDKSELTEIFKQLDTNKDGVISKDELLDGF